MQHQDASEEQQSSPRNQNSPGQNNKEAHVLSCERCARRKIKCDRSINGCANCSRIGVDCQIVARPRLPRGRKTRTGKTNSDLKARLSRLEDLVSTYATPRAESDGVSPMLATPPNQIKEEGAHGCIVENVSRYVGSEFWAILSKEIMEVGEALDSSDDDVGSNLDPPENSGNEAPNFSLLGTSLTPAASIDYLLNDLPMTSALCEVFLYRFAPIVKVGHGPSMRSLMSGQQYLEYRPHQLAPKLLSMAICYAAVQALSEAECRQRFATEKSSLRKGYKHGTESLLSQANLLTTTDLTTLEAFLIYINALRSEDTSRRSWTLTATAARIGQAMNLQLDDRQLKLRPFDREMRRRLWHQIRLTDLRSAYDRGTSSMVVDETCLVPAPLNIDDADFSCATTEPLQARTGYTDMTHALIVVESSGYGPLFKEGGIIRHSPCGIILGVDGSHAYTREQGVAWFRDIEQKYLKHCDMRNDMHWLTRNVTRIIAATSFLFAARPMKHGSDAQSDLSDDSILLLAVEVLEKSSEMRANPRGMAWEWFAFVPWHALAVALAQLCVHRSGPLVDRAWPVIEAAFRHYSRRVADSDHGMLWRPLAKLLRKAQKTRSAHLHGQNQQTPTFEPVHDTTMVPQPAEITSEETLDSYVNYNDAGNGMQYSGNGDAMHMATDADLEWLETLVNQPSYLPAAPEATSWEQWDTFLTNMETNPLDNFATYGTDSTGRTDTCNAQSDITDDPRSLWLGINGCLPTDMSM